MSPVLRSLCAGPTGLTTAPGWLAVFSAAEMSARRDRLWLALQVLGHGEAGEPNHRHDARRDHEQLHRAPAPSDGLQLAMEPGEQGFGRSDRGGVERKVGRELLEVPEGLAAR